MSGSRSWVRHATAAAQQARHRPDLWLPGSLGAVAYLAWLPLLLAVASTPKASDVAFFGARLLSSGSFPWNIAALAALATSGVLLGCLLAALAEAALLRAAGDGTPARSLARETEVAFSVVLVAVLPAVAVSAALVAGIAAVAPAEFGAPDIGGPLLVRIVGHLVPLLVALALVMVGGQALGAAAVRRAVGPRAVSVGTALRGGLRDVVTHPLRRLGLAAAFTLADLLTLAAAIAFLRLLWTAIDVRLRGEQVVGPQMLLLVAFVATWLALVLAFGILHVCVSGWWSLELGQAGESTRPEPQEAIG